MRTGKRRAIAIVGAFIIGLPLAVFATPRREMSFTATQTGSWVNFGTALDDGTQLFMLNAKASAVLTASDPVVSGKGTVTCSGICHTNKVGLLWGSLRFSNIAGTWDGYWLGTNSLEKGRVVMSLAMTAEGSGVYQGWVFRATGTAVDSGPIYWTGFIVNDGQGPSPYQLRGSRLDRAQEITGMRLDPLTLRPNGNKGTIVRITILTEVGEATYLGRSTEQGLGLLDPITGVCSMMGTATSADSQGRDVLRWVAQATTDLRTLAKMDLKRGVANAEVHFAGGTGKFEGATGGFNGRVAEVVSPTPFPAFFDNTFQYEAAGTIRLSGPAMAGE